MAEFQVVSAAQGGVLVDVRLALNPTGQEALRRARAAADGEAADAEQQAGQVFDAEHPLAAEARRQADRLAGHRRQLADLDAERGRLQDAKLAALERGDDVGARAREKDLRAVGSERASLAGLTTGIEAAARSAAEGARAERARLCRQARAQAHGRNIQRGEEAQKDPPAAVAEWLRAVLVGRHALASVQNEQVRRPG